MTATTHDRPRSRARTGESDRSMVFLGYATGLTALVAAVVLGLIR